MILEIGKNGLPHTFHARARSYKIFYSTANVDSCAHWNNSLGQQQQLKVRLGERESAKSEVLPTQKFKSSNPERASAAAADTFDILANVLVGPYCYAICNSVINHFSRLSRALSTLFDYRLRRGFSRYLHNVHFIFDFPVVRCFWCYLFTISI